MDPTLDLDGASSMYSYSSRLSGISGITSSTSYRASPSMGNGSSAGTPSSLYARDQHHGLHTQSQRERYRYPSPGPLSSGHSPFEGHLQAGPSSGVQRRRGSGNWLEGYGDGGLRPASARNNGSHSVGDLQVETEEERRARREERRARRAERAARASGASALERATRSMAKGGRPARVEGKEAQRQASEAPVKRLARWLLELGRDQETKLARTTPRDGRGVGSRDRTRGRNGRIRSMGWARVLGFILAIRLSSECLVFCPGVRPVLGELGRMLVEGD